MQYLSDKIVHNQHYINMNKLQKVSLGMGILGIIFIILGIWELNHASNISAADNAKEKNSITAISFFTLISGVLIAVFFLSGIKNLAK